MDEIFRSKITFKVDLRGEAVVTVFETKTRSERISTKKRVTALKFGITVAFKRYNVEL